MPKAHLRVYPLLSFRLGDHVLFNIANLFTFHKGKIQFTDFI